MLPTINQRQQGVWSIFYPERADCPYSLQVCISHSWASDYVLDPDVFLWNDGITIRVYMDHDEYLEVEAQMEAHEDHVDIAHWHETHFSINNLGISGMYVVQVGDAGLTIREAVDDAITRWKALMLIFAPSVT